MKLDVAKEYFGDEYSVDGVKENNKKYLILTHKVCGTTTKRAMDKITKSFKCPTCKKEQNRIEREHKFKEQLEELGNGEYELLSDYVNAKTTVTLRHKPCGKVFDVKPEKFTGERQQRCPDCTQKRLKKDNIRKETERLQKALGDEYEILGKFTTIRTPIKVKHKTCGTVWSPVPESVIYNGTGCPTCANKRGGEKQRLTQEEAENTIREKLGDEYELVSEYKGYQNKVIIKHKLCGSKYTRNFASIVKGTYKCRVCAKEAKRLKNENAFKDQIKDTENGSFELVSDYVDSVTKVKITHLDCGYTFSVRPNYFVKNARCPECNSIEYSFDYNRSGLKKYHGKTRKKREQKFKEILGDEYELLSEYRSNKDKVTLRHKSCGYVWRVTPGSIMYQHTGCPKCSLIRGSRKQALTQEQARDKLYKASGGELELVGEYKSYHDKVKVRHICGYETERVYNNVLKSFICPNCMIELSAGEHRIAKFLDEHDIDYEREKTYEDLKDDLSLRYDFYLPDYNLLIEYDGKQHYEPSDLYGGEEEFKVRKEHDKMKNEYAKENGIGLLRIPYNQYAQVELILSKRLKVKA